MVRAARGGREARVWPGSPLPTRRGEVRGPEVTERVAPGCSEGEHASGTRGHPRGVRGTGHPGRRVPAHPAAAAPPAKTWAATWGAGPLSQPAPGARRTGRGSSPRSAAGGPRLPSGGPRTHPAATAERKLPGDRAPLPASVPRSQASGDLRAGTAGAGAPGRGGSGESS